MARYSTLVLSVAGAALLTTDVALAQSATLDEIVVTARKRDENLQDVPLSITAIGEQQIERLGIRDLQDITRYTPGVILDQGFGLNDTRLTIRGLSPGRGRPNSAILVDGIDITTESVSTPGGSVLFNQRLLDIEQVEIVKGPQSALYGRAAFTGAISYRTREPGDELETNIGVDVGEYGRRSARFGVGGPVTDTLGLRASGLVWNEDGYYDEGYTGADLGGGDGAGINLVGNWAPSDAIGVRARVSYSEDEYDPQATLFNPINTFITPPASAIGIGSITADSIVGYFGGRPGDVNGRIPFLTPNPGRIDEVGGDPANLPAPGDRTSWEGGFADVLNTSLRFDWDVGDGTFTSYTGYADADTGQNFDGDFDTRPDAAGIEDISRGATVIDFETDTRLLSQELRYASNLDGPLQYVVGALYWDEKSRQVETGISVLAAPDWPGTTPENFFNDTYPGAIITPNNINRDTESISAYGVLEYSPSETSRLTLEARYGRDKMTVQGTGCDLTVLSGLFQCAFATPDTVFPLSPGGPTGHLARYTVTDSKTDHYFAPKATIEWLPSDDLTTYFSLSQGVKPGGITTVGSGAFLDQYPGDGTLDEAKFDAETLTAFEVGAKANLFDSRVTLNGAVFSQRYDDKQVPVQTLVGNNYTTTIENAGKADIVGLELEAVWLVTDYVRLQLGYSYIDGEYTSLTYETDSSNSVARAGNCVQNAGGDFCEIDLSGKSIEDVPRHSLVAVAGWYPPLGSSNLSGLLEADWFYEDKRYIDEFNDREVKSYSLLNLRAGVSSDSWDVLVYVNNALDDDTIRSWSSGIGLTLTAERDLVDPNLAPFPPDGFSIMPPPRHWGVRANLRF